MPPEVAGDAAAAAACDDLSALLAGFDAAELADRLLRNGVPAAAVLTVDQALAHGDPDTVREALQHIRRLNQRTARVSTQLLALRMEEPGAIHLR